MNTNALQLQRIYKLSDSKHQQQNEKENAETKSKPPKQSFKTEIIAVRTSHQQKHETPLNPNPFHKYLTHQPTQ